MINGSHSVHARCWWPSPARQITAHWPKSLSRTDIPLFLIVKLYFLSHRQTLEAVRNVELLDRSSRDVLNDDSNLNLLSAMKAFSEGDKLAQRINYKASSSKCRGYSEVTLGLLDALVQRLPQMGLVSGSREAPRSINDFLGMYWSLAFRSKLASVSTHPSSQSFSPQTTDAIHSRQMTVYATLCSFLCESRLQDEEFT